MTTADWPVLRHYDRDHLQRISLPLGGIGTGTVGLGGRGDLRDFELANRPGKGFRPQTAFIALRAKVGDEEPHALVVEGPLPIEDYEGAFGSPAPHHGLPRFRDCSFDVAYPLAQVHLRDDDFPLAVALQAYNPFVVGDVDTSAIPVAVLRYRVTNTASEPAEVTAVASLSNPVGSNGVEDLTGGNQNTTQQAPGVIGVTMTAPELDPDAEAAGNLTLALLDDGLATTSRAAWADLSWGGGLLDFWDDLLDDGRLDERTSDLPRPTASLAGTATLAPGETRDFTFLLTWNFPNRRAWRSEEYGGINVGEYSDVIIGNAYSRRYPDSWQTAQQVADRLPELEAATVESVSAIVGTDAPPAIIEGALFNLSTLRSPTVFCSDEGEFYGWEGVGDDAGSCYGTCTHVWGYEFATSLLFAPIAQSFRRTQFARCTDDRGLMSFRAGLPVELSQSWSVAAADGQMACIVHLYVDWKLSGDEVLIKELWPAAKRALEFCWIPGGWDGDQDGVMEGVQHNTMDVEYYGPNPQMGSWYLAALRSAEELARVADDPEFADRCRSLFDSGSAWLDANLFDGSYYRHEIRPVTDPADIAVGLRHQSMGAADTSDPALQLGAGSLVDQLVGQYAATLAGLGDLLDPGNVRTALLSVHRRNFKTSFVHHFNPMRSFVLGEESATLMCSYEGVERPTRPFPYFDEVMTGFEWTAATGLLQVGETGPALQMITAIRDRYDGARRNPFDEAECGHHYARAMAAWSSLVAWSDLSYDAPSATFTVGDRAPAGASFWSSGTAWGHWEPVGEPQEGRLAGTLTVLRGQLRVDNVRVAGSDHRPSSTTLTAGSRLEVPRAVVGDGPTPST